MSPSTTRLVVIMSGQVAGMVTRRAGRLELVYDEDYRRSPDATPLSVSMPLAAASHPHSAIAPWLDGLLPDDDAVRRSWGRQFQVSASSPFALLATPIGEECAGAAQFLTQARVEEALAARGRVTWLSDADVGERIAVLNRDATAWLGADFTGRFSLAGAQAKTALLYDRTKRRWGIPAGAAATSHILKPAIPGFDGHELNELLCLRTAHAVGLPTAPTSLLRIGGVSAVVSRRYDRAPGKGRWLVRIHQEDLCQALGIPPDSRYQNEGGPDVRRIVTLLRDVIPASAVPTAVRSFFDAVTFSWLIGGTDAHAKNYSLLLAGSDVALAPLYDLASALPYRQASLHKLRLAMKYGGDYTLRARMPSMWAAVAGAFGLPEDEVRERARTLGESIPDALRAESKAKDVRAMRSGLPDALVDAVTDRVERCLATLR